MKAFIFPGQGSQILGMGKTLNDTFRAAKDVFEEVNDSIGFDLRKVMFEGPESEITATENAQPAIMTVSLAVIKVLEKEFNFDIKKHINYVAGHSLGEYSALATAGVFDIKTVADILKVRGRAMQSSTPSGIGGMVAILGIKDMQSIEDLIKKSREENEACVIANDNCIGQVVLSGNIRSIGNVIENAKEFGATKAIKLSVSGSFHSPLMQKASEIMAEKLSTVDLKSSTIPVVSNVSAKATTDKDEIKVLLIEQVVKGVRWRESMEYLVGLGVKDFIEIGQGNVLSGLMKRIDSSSNRINLQNPEDIENFISSLK